jgi:hypothetical protein
MSSVALFAYGVLVTLLVGAGIGLLVWGAILDGRYDREVREGLRLRPVAGEPTTEDDPHLQAVS